MLGTLFLPIPGGGKRKLIGEAVEAAPHLLRRGSPIKAWSGSSAKFDVADITKIGTGEGNATFTPGLYSSTVPEIGAHYARVPERLGRISQHRDADISEVMQLYPELRELWLAMKARTDVGPTMRNAREALQEVVHGPQNFNIEAVTKMESTLPSAEIEKRKRLAWQLQQLPDEALNRLFHFQQGNLERPGYLYEQQLHLDPSKVIDWDLNVLQQPKNLRRALFDVLQEFDLTDYVPTSLRTGATMRRLQRAIPHQQFPTVMREAGIEATSYPSGLLSSHIAADVPLAKGTNYVTYDDRLVELVRRFPMMAGLLAAAGLTTGLLREDKKDE